MRHYLRAGALMTVLTAGMFFPKQSQAQDLKIAVVDIETLTLNTDEGKAVSARVQKKYDEIATVMDKLQKEITEKEGQLRNARALSETAKGNLSREIDNLKKSFDRKNEDYQKELTDYQNDLLDPIAGKAQARLQAFLKEKNFTLVIDLSAQKGNVVWANPNNDITLEVIKQLNDDYKKATAAPPAAAAPRTPGAAAPAAGTRPPAATPTATPSTR